MTFVMDTTAHKAERTITIIEASRIQWPEEEFNIDLPVYFIWLNGQEDLNVWSQVKGPTNKYHHEFWYTYCEYNKDRKSTKTRG